MFMLMKNFRPSLLSSPPSVYLCGFNLRLLLEFSMLVAGIAATAPLLEQDIEDVSRIFQTNTLGVLRCIQVEVVTKRCWN